ncbi:MAG: TFIIB-type zinc ribbon-containing protein [Oscillospiraceae bacterium]|jgi:DNA-directed RNA polymerase subunit RPC12/RpoP|nr:TFIIB-type zinc ribbon-containing protein [Oscillospiraceae bacterium]
MALIEKVAYLKGLADGLELDVTTKEGKVLSAIIGALEEIANEVDELSETVYDLLEDADCDCDCCGGDDDDDDEAEFAITCPNCSEDIDLTEEDQLAGEVTCPRCGYEIEFEVYEDDDE